MDFYFLDLKEGNLDSVYISMRYLNGIYRRRFSTVWVWEHFFSKYFFR